MWSAYAIVEYVLLSVIPLFLGPHGVFTSGHWHFSGLLFDGYWILGALTGAAAGTAVRNWSLSPNRATARRLDLGRLPATLGLLIAVQVNLCFAFPTGGFALLTLAVAAALSGTIVWVLRHPESSLVDVVEFHPLLLAFLLIAPTWLSTEALEDFSLGIKIAVVATVLPATFGLNWMLRGAPRWSAGAHFLSSLALAALVVFGSGFKSGAHKVFAAPPPSALADPARPPVVLVTFDTTRADHMSLYGYSRNTTPYLTQFAGGATLFTDTMAAGDMTLTTHASMFTGVYPSWHGAEVYPVSEGGPHALDGRLPTLAGILSAQGYSTAAVVANSAYLVPRWGLDRGFGTFSVQNVVEVTSSKRPFQLRHGIRLLLSWAVPATDLELRYRRAEDINAEALRVLSYPSFHNRSFFLFVNYMDAHGPYRPPPPFDTIFLGGPARGNLWHFPAELHRNISNGDLERSAALYDGGIAYQDFAFHQLIQALKRQGLYDRSIIIVVGDHGEAFGDHGAWGHGTSVYDSQVSVPLVIKFPGQTTASVVRTPVSQVDLLPTVLDTLGYPLSPDTQGRSLRNPGALDSSPVFAESSAGMALRWGGMKLIAPTAGRREAYNLGSDTGESRNLYSHGAPGIAAIDAAFDQWLRLLPHQTKSSPVDPRELRRLQGLGYVQ
jgi:arylsulfatase A-like enzyme